MWMLFIWGWNPLNVNNARNLFHKSLVWIDTSKWFMNNWSHIFATNAKSHFQQTKCWKNIFHQFMKILSTNVTSAMNLCLQEAICTIISRRFIRNEEKKSQTQNDLCSPGGRSSKQSYSLMLQFDRKFILLFITYFVSVFFNLKQINCNNT